MGQLALPFAWGPADGRGYLVSAANEGLLAHLDRWSLWPVMATVLTGPAGSGRSLLARGFAARTGGEAIDDAGRADEEAVFHAWNRAQARRRPLLIVADDGPPGWAPALPDLRSRLAATPVVRIAEPDEPLLAALIERLCQDRGLAVPPELAAYLVARVGRSYRDLHRTVDALDTLAFAQRQRLTIPLARRALIGLGVIDVSHASA